MFNEISCQVLQGALLDDIVLHVLKACFIHPSLHVGLNMEMDNALYQEYAIVTKNWMQKMKFHSQQHMLCSFQGGTYSPNAKCGIGKPSV